jgi:hypothetical protein
MSPPTTGSLLPVVCRRAHVFTSSCRRAHVFTSSGRRLMSLPPVVGGSCLYLQLFPTIGGKDMSPPTTGSKDTSPPTTGGKNMSLLQLEVKT